MGECWPFLPLQHLMYLTHQRCAWFKKKQLLCMLCMQHMSMLFSKTSGQENVIILVQNSYTPNSNIIYLHSESQDISPFYGCVAAQKQHG